MTRFIMTLDEAVDLVIFAFENGETGDILVQKADASTVGVLAQATSELFEVEHKERVIGIRHGEKLYETLLTNEESAKAIDLGNYYRVPADKRGLNYDKYLIEGEPNRNLLSEFNSNNTKLLSVEQTKDKLLKVPEIVKELKDWKTT